MASKEARAAYQKEYREKNPEVKERNRLMNKARHRALQDVVNNHQAEYRTRLEIRRQELGLVRGKPGRPPVVDEAYEKWKKGKK